ncbi:MAG: SUMF1/EgtB/PvdO family nonheme iron enzyme, partial [Pseudomonadales bacterium]
EDTSLEEPEYPVVSVRWLDAVRYCNWLSDQEGLPRVYTLEGDEVTGFDPDATGYRLPTEAEWAFAARMD